MWFNAKAQGGGAILLGPVVQGLLLALIRQASLTPGGVEDQTYDIRMQRQAP